RGAGNRKRRDVARGRHVRAAAQVVPFDLAGARVDVRVGGQLACTDLHGLLRVRRDVALILDQLELVWLGRVFGAGLIVRAIGLALKALAGLVVLLHLSFDLLQFLGREGLRNVEFVLETTIVGCPIPSLVPGNTRCTAWARTCAVEWRITPRPSSVSDAIAATS